MVVLRDDAWQGGNKRKAVVAMESLGCLLRAWSLELRVIERRTVTGSNEGLTLPGEFANPPNGVLVSGIERRFVGSISSDQ